jgi:hypothetical protein
MEGSTVRGQGRGCKRGRCARWLNLAQRLSFPPRAGGYNEGGREREREGRAGSAMLCNADVSTREIHLPNSIRDSVARYVSGDARRNVRRSTRLGSAYPRDSIHVPRSEDTATVSGYRQLISLASVAQTAPQLSPSCSSADSSTTEWEAHTALGGGPRLPLTE